MMKSIAALSRGSVFGVLLFLCALAPAPAASAAVDASALEETRDWAVLAGGRAKPLLTYANETVLSITGRKKLEGLNALEIFWGYALAPDDFRGRALIRVESPSLKEALELDPKARRFSFTEIMASAQFQDLARSASDRQRDGMKLTALERDALSVYSKIVRVADLMQGAALSIVPLTDSSGNWSTPRRIQASSDAKTQAIAMNFGTLVVAFSQDDGEVFRSAAIALRSKLRDLNPSVYPSEAMIERELFYEDLNPFGNAWKLYLVGSLILMLLGFSTKRWLYLAALAFLGAGFVLHTMGVGLRWSVSGFAPVSNMYESLTFMGWGIMALGFVQEAIYKKRFFVLAGGVASFLCLAFSENLPIDSSINPLVPVLAHTSWLAIHVMTIMLSYSAFALAMVMGHFALFTQLWKPDRKDLMRSLALLLYNTLQVGLLFLAAGIICGAVWANESWGRYWGWDPKETWSLITFFIYLAVVHARFAGWLEEFGLAASAIIGFLSVIMTYYGVNFVLGAGQHAYGGDSQQGPLWMLLFAIVEIGVIGLAYVRYRPVAASHTSEEA